MRPATIEELTRPVRESDIRELAGLLVDAVESGASVSFLAPLSPARAAEWWRETLSKSHPRAAFLVARDDQGIVGTVQFHPAWAPNQPHRAEVAKLIVHRRGRQKGIGRALMHALETRARSGGFTLLTLDAKRGEVAESLYRKMGWTYVGVIPAYALNADGSGPSDTVIFYKDLHGSAEPAGRAAQTPGTRLNRMGAHRPHGTDSDDAF
jgi:GNAT superfamily N-acetyltransferase